MTTTKRIVSSVEQTSSETEAGWMRSAVDKVARTWIFQAILRQLDTFLWVVEKSAEWSLPRNEGETEESMKTDLVRPLPWMLFLPTLLFLRMIRASLNMIALMLGFPRVSSISMVRFAQNSRYRLARIGNTSRSSEKMRRKREVTQDKRLSMNRAKKALIRSIRLTLSTLSCLDGSKPSLSPPPTRIHISALDLDAATEKSATGSSVPTNPTLEGKQRQEVATKSDVSTETKLGRNDQLVPELCNSHDVNITDGAIKRTRERSCEEKSYDGRNENEETTEESNVEEDESDKEEMQVEVVIEGQEDEEDEEEEEEEEEEEKTKNDEEKQKKHEGKGGKGERHKVECDQEKDGRNEYDEEEGSKVECDMAECDLIEQPDSLSTEDNSSEKTPALSQDSDAHFFSPVESSASRSRSSSNSSASNDIPRQPVSSSSTSPVQNSHQRNTFNTNEYGNGEAHFIAEQTTPDRKIDVTKNRCPLSTGRPFEEANNVTVMGKRGANASKYHHHHHRGKRTSHGNRKKK